jgi:hypothetical protein
MKRIAAFTGVVAAALAVPATAMAGTAGPASGAGGSASGIARPTAVHIACPRPGHPGQVKVIAKGQVPPGKQVRTKQLRVRVTCLVKPPFPVKPPRPAPQPCLSRGLTFDMPSWSSRITEVSGPRLSVGEHVFYRGTAYTITSVAGRTVTADRDGTPVENHGRAITHGIAYTMCGSRHES